MIQRIQTIWLGLAIVCMVLCFTMPMAEYTLLTADGVELTARYGLSGDSSADLQEATGNVMPMSTIASWPMIALALGTILASILAIFLYHNRVVQMRVVAVALLFCMAYIALTFIWAVDGYGDMAATYVKALPAKIIWKAGSFMPLGAMVLFILAQRAIKSDERKVRAADRLR